MSSVEQNECQTVNVKNCQEVFVVESESESQATATSADKNATDTLADIFPHTAEDAEAESHTMKVLTEEAEHEACMPGCLQAKSVSTPSTSKDTNATELNALTEPTDASELKEVRCDCADSPAVPSVDDRSAQANAITSDITDKLGTAQTSGPSKETKNEERVESPVDAAANPSDQEKLPSIISSTGVRTFRVLAVPPQDLFFTVPQGCKSGQSVWVRGPHGPLQVQVPPGVKPGKRAAVRLAAPFQHQIVVPEGAKPGDTVAFTDENGDQLQAVVPPGKKSGQAFGALPPVAMLRIPDGALAGDRLQFKVPAVPANPQAPAHERLFEERTATVPANMVPGQYFATMITDVPKVHDQTDADLSEVWI